MNRLAIVCDTCERVWSVAAELSFYEQQALESRPCPRCAAYTLTCQDAAHQEEAGERTVSWSSFAA